MANKQELSKHRERARYYWTKALQAEESAGRAEDLESREHFLSVARGWRIMAERIEREL
jgi:hypothetical protein